MFQPIQSQPMAWVALSLVLAPLIFSNAYGQEAQPLMDPALKAKMVGQSVALPMLQNGLDVTTSEQSVSGIQAGRDTQLNGTIVHGAVQTGRDLQATSCQAFSNLMAGRDASLVDCTLSSVKVGRKLALVRSTVNGDVTAGTFLRLDEATVNGSATAPQASLKKASVSGLLTISANTTDLDESSVGGIVIEPPTPNQINLQVHNQGTRVVMGNGNLSVSGGSVVTRGHNNQFAITVGPGSTSNINGYAVNAVAEKTMLTTPEGLVYINGALINGKGPTTYQAYQQAHTNAPSIEGPGWVNNPEPDSEAGHPIEKTASEAKNEPVQIVFLKNNSTVSGNIVFKQGSGQVVIEPGCTLTGEVIGGERVEL